MTTGKTSGSTTSSFNPMAYGPTMIMIWGALILRWAQEWALSSLTSNTLPDFFTPEMRQQFHAFQEVFHRHDTRDISQQLHGSFYQRFRDFAKGALAFTSDVHGIKEGHDSLCPPSSLPVLWSNQDTRLLDYGTFYGLPKQSGRPRVLVIPSLLNSPGIFNIGRDGGFVKHLVQRGLHPYAVAWSEPHGDALAESFDTQIERRLMPLMAFLSETSKDPLFLLGYCMGGLMALSLLSRLYTTHQTHDPVKGIGLFAVPWDFTMMPRPSPLMTAMIKPFLQDAKQQKKLIPAHGIQSYFQMMALPAMMKKMRAWGGMSGDEKSFFFPMEHWLHQSLGLSASLVEECMENWFEANAPHHHDRLGTHPLHPKVFSLPMWGVLGHKDQVVPPASSRPLYGRFPQGQVHDTPMGHLGLFSSRHAQTTIWDPLIDWINKTTETPS